MRAIILVGEFRSRPIPVCDARIMAFSLLNTFCDMHPDMVVKLDIVDSDNMVQSSELLTIEDWNDFSA